jgi:hypothetical protein
MLSAEAFQVKVKKIEAQAKKKKGFLDGQSGVSGIFASSAGGSMDNVVAIRKEENISDPVLQTINEFIFSIKD